MEITVDQGNMRLIKIKPAMWIKTAGSTTIITITPVQTSINNQIMIQIHTLQLLTNPKVNLQV